MQKFFLLVAYFFIASCSKEAKFLEKDNEIPNFSSVNLESIFNSKDAQLDNKDSIVKLLDTYYNEVWVRGNLSGGFLVAKGDEILYEKYQGFSRENSPRPLSVEDPLHVASISKTMTAMTVMKLVEAGKIRLNQTVATILPDFPYKDIEVIHLLNQRSGLPKYEYFIDELGYKSPTGFLSNADVLNLLAKHKPEQSRATNTGFMYCNTNYAMLALIVERVTEKSFPEAMKLILFQPLKMNNSFVFQPKDIFTAAQSFYNRDQRVYPLDQLDGVYGDKNIYTTPRDLLNFSKALYSQDFLRPDLMQKVFTPYSNEKPGVNNYGLGFRMKVFENGEKLTFHTGWWHGSNAVFAHLLKSNVTIIAVGNKFSRRIYSALSIAGLFEDFPLERERFYTTIKHDLTQTDTLNHADSVSEE